MKKNFYNPEFFLGANTPFGFYSIFKNLYSPENGWICHILKGGPGTGKSTLMKNIAKKALSQNCSHEKIRCSSDPKSLDAIILNNQKKCIVDGTAPHIIDPKYPAISEEIINLGNCWNKKKLQKSKEKILSLFKENSQFHKISQKYLSALGYAFEANTYIMEKSINYEKLNSFCEKFSKKIFKKSFLKPGIEKKRFVTGITPDGYIFLSNTANNICEKIFVIEDKSSIIGSYILEFIRKIAIFSGYNIISCPSPFDPSQYLEAVFLKDLKIGIVVKNELAPKDFLSLVSVKTEKIYTKKFMDLKIIEKNKNIIKFNIKICKEFLKESVTNLSKARKIHDEIEKFYINAMDFKKVNKITQKLASF